MSARPPQATSPSTLTVILVLALIVCAYDVFVAVRGNGHNYVAWILAAVMALVALGALRKLVRKDYSNSWW
jgi:hypothetical protein